MCLLTYVYIHTYIQCRSVRTTYQAISFIVCVFTDELTEVAVAYSVANFV